MIGVIVILLCLCKAFACHSVTPQVASTLHTVDKFLSQEAFLSYQPLSLEISTLFSKKPESEHAFFYEELKKLFLEKRTKAYCADYIEGFMRVKASDCSAYFQCIDHIFQGYEKTTVDTHSGVIFKRLTRFPTKSLSRLLDIYDLLPPLEDKILLFKRLLHKDFSVSQLLKLLRSLDHVPQDVRRYIHIVLFKWDGVKEPARLSIRDLLNANKLVGLNAVIFPVQIDFFMQCCCVLSKEVHHPIKDVFFKIVDHVHHDASKNRIKLSFLSDFCDALARYAVRVNTKQVLEYFVDHEFNLLKDYNLTQCIHAFHLFRVCTEEELNSLFLRSLRINRQKKDVLKTLIIEYALRHVVLIGASQEALLHYALKFSSQFESLHEMCDAIVFSGYMADPKAFLSCFTFGVLLTLPPKTKQIFYTAMRHIRYSSNLFAQITHHFFQSDWQKTPDTTYVYFLCISFFIYENDVLLRAVSYDEMKDDLHVFYHQWILNRNLTPHDYLTLKKFFEEKYVSG